jgi:hypothetical protein
MSSALLIEVYLCDFGSDTAESVPADRDRDFSEIAIAVNVWRTVRP